MSIWGDRYLVGITLVEPLLGTIPKRGDLYEQWIRTQAPVPEPAEIPPGAEEKGWTGFYEDGEGFPVFMDYQLKGFLKESGNILKEVVGFKALRSHLDNEVFVFPRRTRLGDVPALKLEYEERPLRAMTMQGPRVSLVRSDKVPPGTSFDIELSVIAKSRITQGILSTLFEYGSVKGLGQWRNGSYGRFTFTLEPAS